VKSMSVEESAANVTISNKDKETQLYNRDHQPMVRALTLNIDERTNSCKALSAYKGIYIRRQNSVAHMPEKKQYNYDPNSPVFPFTCQRYIYENTGHGNFQDGD
jgi:hypothetical protein